MYMYTIMLCLFVKEAGQLNGREKKNRHWLILLCTTSSNYTHLDNISFISFCQDENVSRWEEKRDTENQPGLRQKGKTGEPQFSDEMWRSFTSRIQKTYKIVWLLWKRDVDVLESERTQMKAQGTGTHWMIILSPATESLSIFAHGKCSWLLSIPFLKWNFPSCYLDNGFIVSCSGFGKGSSG